jgi:hypothetical protein
MSIKCQKRRGDDMGVVCRGKEINKRRRVNKKRTDSAKSMTYRHEVKMMFDKYYRDQVAALYREICR